MPTLQKTICFTAFMCFSEHLGAGSSALSQGCSLSEFGHFTSPQSVPRHSCLGTAQPGVPAWLSPWPEQCLHRVLHPEHSKLPPRWDGTCWRQLWLSRLYSRTPGQQVMFSKLGYSLCMQSMRNSSLLSHCKSQELFSVTYLNSLRNSSCNIIIGKVYHR